MTAFLYRFQDEIIYIEQPHHFELNPKLVCCLRNALYRLKQAPRVRYKTLADFLIKVSLEHLELDYDVFVSQDQQLFIAIYIDDLFLFASDVSHFTDIQDQLSVQFKMSNLGEISHYLGIEIDVEFESKFLFDRLPI